MNVTILIDLIQKWAESLAWAQAGDEVFVC